jgi:hypothetical protein
MNFYRTMAYQKPVLIMDYIEVLGQPTRVGTREGFERHWKWCALFGAHPSIGRYCDKAWAMYPDVYRRFREPIRRIAAAGWEPVTYARTNHSGIRVERFGDGKRGLYFTVMNVSSEAVEVSLEPDAQALGLPQGVQARDLLSDLAISSPLRFSLAAGDLRILQMSLP